MEVLVTVSLRSLPNTFQLKLNFIRVGIGFCERVYRVCNRRIRKLDVCIKGICILPVKVLLKWSAKNIVEKFAVLKFDKI